jgi:hypothetical protein
MRVKAVAAEGKRKKVAGRERERETERERGRVSRAFRRTESNTLYHLSAVTASPITLPLLRPISDICDEMEIGNF